MECVMCVLCPAVFLFFFFNDTATTEIYTLSLHDALPISSMAPIRGQVVRVHNPGLERFVLDGENPEGVTYVIPRSEDCILGDRKSTRLNSSHANISYAVFCLKKKKHNNIHL